MMAGRARVGPHKNIAFFLSGLGWRLLELFALIRFACGIDWGMILISNNIVLIYKDNFLLNGGAVAPSYHQCSETGE
jgi:hypothetical protein